MVITGLNQIPSLGICRQDLVKDVIIKIDILSQAARTKYCRLGGLNKRHFFLTVLKAEMSKTKVLADLAPGEGSISSLVRATNSLCAYRFFCLHTELNLSQLLLSL